MEITAPGSVLPVRSPSKLTSADQCEDDGEKPMLVSIGNEADAAVISGLRKQVTERSASGRVRTY